MYIYGRLLFYFRTIYAETYRLQAANDFSTIMQAEYKNKPIEIIKLK
jgi:uncharacterized protein YfdQ (DUF2303 family)